MGSRLKNFYLKWVTETSLKKLYLKWTLLVVASAVLSFLLGVLVGDYWTFLLGMLAGIICFIFIYTQIDYYLAQHYQTAWRKSLLIGVCIKMVMQLLIPPVEVLCGTGALNVTEFIFDALNIDISIFTAFLFSWIATVITGLLLSLVVGILTLIIKWILLLSNRHHQS